MPRRRAGRPARGSTIQLHRVAASHLLAEARKVESKALAGLHKACWEADPQSRVIDVEATDAVELVALPSP